MICIWRTFCTAVDSAGSKCISVAGDDVVDFLLGTVIVGDPGGPVDLAALEPRAQDGQAVCCTEREQSEGVVVGRPRSMIAYDLIDN